MLRSAVRGAAGMKVAAMTAACTCALLLAACGNPSGAPAATDGGKPVATADATGGPASQGAGQGGSVTATPTAAAPLDTTGWVLPPPFYAAGDEPFWRLDIADGWFSFKRSGLPEIEAPMTQPTRTNGADVFDSSPLKIRIKREACATDEGKGDVSAVVTFDDTEFEGCAFGGTSNAVSAEASTVVDALKAIDACLAKLGDPALVTAVYPREGDRTAVALRAKDSSLYECAVESDGSIAFLDPTEPRSAGAWMSKFRFLRKGVADATKCDGAEEVRSGDKVVGRLLAKTCKF